MQGNQIEKENEIMQVENIKKFLETAYTDEKLVALLAHTQDNKLGYGSCCCLIGIPTADHALQEAPGMSYLADAVSVMHYDHARGLPYALMAEMEFRILGSSDAERRERLLPLIEQEQARRSQMQASAVYSGDAGDEQVERVHG